MASKAIPAGDLRSSPSCHTAGVLRASDPQESKEEATVSFVMKACFVTLKSLCPFHDTGSPLHCGRRLHESKNTRQQSLGQLGGWLPQLSVSSVGNSRKTLWKRSLEQLSREQGFITWVGQNSRSL